jgi:asparagine synthase (glutamine-hydrolysing)
MAWGLEARVPFLDKAFLEVAMNVDPSEKMFHKGTTQEMDEDGCPRMEKVHLIVIFYISTLIPFFRQYILRKAFDCSPDGKVRKLGCSKCRISLIIC